MRPVDWFFVTVLLLFTAALRFTGITFGQPDPQYSRSLYPLLHIQSVLHPDEYFYVSIPYEMLVRGRKLPHFYENPSFLIDLNWLTFALTGSQQTADVARWEGLNNRSFAPFELYIIGRVYSALGGLMTVAAVYAATRIIIGRRGAALAVILAAVSMPLVQHAHYSTTSSPATGFSMVCLLACLICLKCPTLPAFIWLTAGIAAGLAAGNRYNAAAIAIVLFLTGLACFYRARTRRTLALIFAGYLAVPLVFVVTTPGVIFNSAEFWQQFRFIYSRFASSGGLMHGLFYEYRYIVVFGTGILALPLILAGIFAAWRMRESKRWFTLAVLTWLVYLAAYSVVVLNTPVPEIGDQLTLPVIPIYILFAAIGAGWLLKYLPQNRLLPPVIIAAVIAQPAIPTLQWLYVLSQPDTRELMQAWIDANLPHGARIHLGGGYNVPLDDADYAVSRDEVYQNEVEDLRNSGVDYLVYSDAAHFAARRDGALDIVNPGYYGYAALPALAWINRPALWGADLMPNNSIYWHNPGIIIYCVKAEPCD